MPVVTSLLNFWRSPWFFIHDRHFPWQGFTSSISHHSLLNNSIHCLSWIQLLCDEILPNSYYTQKTPIPPNFFRSWLFGSIFVFILSLNHGPHGPDHGRRCFFPHSVFCSFSLLVPHCNSKFLKLECLDVFELRSFTTPRKFNCFEHAKIFSYNPCQDLTSVLFQAHDSNTICFSKSCSD